MICYASHTHNKRNLAALREAGWRLMISRARPDGNPEGMRYALDNGAWTDFQSGRDFDDGKFRDLVDRLGGAADFIVAPDIVAGGKRSLYLSLVWLAPLLVRTKLVLIAVQDGLEPADLVTDNILVADAKRSAIRALFRLVDKLAEQHGRPELAGAARMAIVVAAMQGVQKQVEPE